MQQNPKLANSYSRKCPTSWTRKLFHNHKQNETVPTRSYCCIDYVSKFSCFYFSNVHFFDDSLVLMLTEWPMALAKILSKELVVK